MPNPRGTYYKKPSKCELCHHVFVTPTALRKHLEQSLCIQFDKLTSEKVNEILNSKATNVNKGVLEVQDVFTYILSETRLAECSKGDVRVVSSRGPTNAFRHYESLHIPMIGFLMCRACEATFVKTLTNAKVHLKTCPMRKPRDGSLRKWDNDKKEYLDRSLGAVEPESRPNTCLDQAALIKAARVAPDNESATEAQGNSRPAVGRTFTSTSRKEIDQSGKSEPLTEEEDEESDSSTDFGSTYPRAHLAAKGSQAAEEHARRRTSSVTSVFEAQARHDLTPRTTRARAKDGEVLLKRDRSTTALRRSSRITAGRITKPQRPVILRDSQTHPPGQLPFSATSRSTLFAPAPFDDLLREPVVVQRSPTSRLEEDSASIGPEEDSPPHSHFDDAWHW